MLTFLSRWFGSLTLPQAARELPGPQAAEENRGVVIRLHVRPRHPDLPDIEVMDQPGATAFVAGAGARIYSLDVFRRERTGRPAA